MAVAEIEAEATMGRLPDKDEHHEKQEANIEGDLGSYTKVWPILNIGLRIGVGD